MRAFRGGQTRLHSRPPVNAIAPGRSPRLAVAFACAALLATAAFSPRAIPYCMDEFVHYHALGCAAYPLTAQFDAWREGCGRYDLALPFTATRLPLRSYHYIGSLPALPFLPFWAAIRDPLAARVQGAAFFALALALLADLAGISFLEALLAASVYPLFPLAFLVDLGPSGLSVLLLLGLLHALRAAARAGTPARRLALSALAGGIAFLGLWVKLVFAWVLPAAAAYAFAQALRAGGPLRRHLPSALLAVVVAAVPTLLLLFARDAEGVRYVEVVREGNLSLEARNYYAFLRMGRYLLDGAAVLPRTLRLPGGPLDAAPLLLACATLAFAWRSHRAWGGFLLLGLLSLGVTVVTRSAWAPHHVVLALFFLVCALGRAVAALGARSRWAPALLAAAVMLFWASLAVRLPRAEVSADTNAAKDSLLRQVRRERLDARTLQAHVSWGTYYIAQLFGDPAQAVLWVDAAPDHPEDLAALRAYADRLGRGVLIVTSRSPERIDTPALRSALGPPLETLVRENWRAVRYVR
jgi:hypothetical protein